MTITLDQQAKYLKRRADFISFLSNERMFATLSLMQQCTYELTDDPKHAASIQIKPNSAPTITMNVKLLDHSDLFNYAMLHELRHIPQMARFGGDEFLASVPWPTFVDTPVKRRVVFRMYANIAMDMALNEDLRRMLTETSFQSVMNRLIPTITGGQEGKLCFVENPEWKRDQDFVYYMLKLIEEQDQKDGGADAGPQGYQQMDDHQGPGEEGDGSAEGGANGEAARGNLRDLLQRAEQESKTLSNQRGYAASDADLTLTGNGVNDQVRSFIRQIKVKVNRLFEGKSQKRYAFEKFNRLWPKSQLPGQKAHSEKIPGIVIVLDTSGSVVYDESVFNQLRGAVLELERLQKVKAVYCCDVKLHRLKNNTQVKGGGGTLLDWHHFDEIRKDLGLKPTEQITVIGIGDGDWSTEKLKRAPNVDFHELVLQRSR